MTSLIRLIPVFLLVFLAPLVWAGSCENLNCDCGNIPNEPLQKSCSAHERLLKDFCPNDNEDVRGYCAVHGPDAFPVAISLVVPNVEPSADIGSSDRQVAQLYWSIRQDATFSINAFEKADYVSAAAVLKISKRNLNHLFETQLSVAEAWRVAEKNKKVKKAWKNYSADTLSLAEFWQKQLKVVTAEAEAGNVKGSDGYWAYNQRLAQLVASMYELSGYSFARAEKYRSAAQAWKAASGISADILKDLVERKADRQEIEKYKSQTTSRLHRASLYWLQGSREKDPDKKAKDAIEYASDKLLQEILFGGDVTSE